MCYGHNKIPPPPPSAAGAKSLYFLDVFRDFEQIFDGFFLSNNQKMVTIVFEITRDNLEKCMDEVFYKNQQKTRFLFEKKLVFSAKVTRTPTLLP